MIEEDPLKCLLGVKDALILHNYEQMERCLRLIREQGNMIDELSMSYRLALETIDQLRGQVAELTDYAKAMEGRQG